MAPVQHDQLPLLVGAALAALLVFIVLLAYLKKSSKRTRKVQVENISDAEGTKFVEEDGHLVRRSTRQRKPAASTVEYATTTPAKTPKPEATEKATPRTTRSASKAKVSSTPAVDKETPKPSKTRISGAESAPKSGYVTEEEETSRPLRSRRVPRV